VGAQIFHGYGEAHGTLARFFKSAASAPFAQIKAVPEVPARVVDPQVQAEAKEHVAALLPRKRGRVDLSTAGSRSHGERGTAGAGRARVEQVATGGQKAARGAVAGESKVRRDGLGAAVRGFCLRALR